MQFWNCDAHLRDNPPFTSTSKSMGAFSEWTFTKKAGLVKFGTGYLSIGHETGSKRIECLVTRFSRCVQLTKNWLFPGEFAGSHIFRANMPTFVECCSWFSMQTQWICCMKPSGISWMIREVNQKPSNTWNGHGKHSYMMATWQYEQCSKSVVDGWWLYGTNNYHHGKPRCLANQCQRKLRRYRGTASRDLAATCASPEMQVSWGWKFGWYNWHIGFTSYHIYG